MARRHALGDRVDGLYDGNSDDVWYPGFISAVHDDDETYDVLYDDGEAEYHVLAQYVRPHQLGTLCVGSRVYGRYAGGDEWYAGKIQEVQDDGLFTIEYDDGEVETNVISDFVRETLVVAAEEVSEGDPPEAPQDVSVVATAAVAADRPPTPVDDDTRPAQVEDERELESSHADEQSPVANSEESPESVSSEQEPSLSPNVTTPAELSAVPQPPAAAAADRETEDKQHDSQDHPEHPRVEELSSSVVKTISSVVDTQGVVDEFSTIQATIERLESSQGDAVATKTLLSTLVKQMRAFPQATADLVHSRGGEGLLIDILKQHNTHAVIQCYGFVLLRRLCFLCGKSTHFFLRSGIVELVTIAMRKFPEDAILQASACGALAVFTRVHAGLSALLANRISHLVLATIIFHKAYSVHTRQVHYYACEVLLELCELGDKTTIEALCGDGISGPGLSDLSPVSLLLFLLRQALSFDDKKACCAAGTLLMCLASCHRHAAQMILDLNGLSELSTVMAKFPMEPGIQKYAQATSREIALCSMDNTSPQRRSQNALRESNSMEELAHQRQQQRRTAGKSKSGGTKRKAPPSQRSGVSSLNGFPSPAHQHQIGVVAGNSRDALSFSKYASPIGKAPHLPPNIRSFGDAPSPSAALYHHQMQQQHRNQIGSPLVILDSRGAMISEKKRFVKDERTNLLFETYGVDAKAALHQSHANEHHARTHGIKRRQLKTHIVSASAVVPASEQISWASPVKSIILQDTRPLSSRSEKQGAKVSTGDALRLRTSSGDMPAAIDGEPEEYSPATLRRQQQQQSKTVTTTSSEDRTSRSATFQLKLDQAHATSSTAGTGSPIVLSPKSGRNGSRSKAASKTKSTNPSSRATMSTRDHGVGLNASTESLNSYATQLFKDELEASSQEALANRQERERLSFAEKLHKMIDKAKSTLAHTGTVSLATESQISPTKTVHRSEPEYSANGKKKQAASTSVATSRVAPASKKPTTVVGDTPATVSASDAALPKRVPPKPTPTKKPVAATPAPATSKHIDPPKSSRATGPAATRPAPAASSSVMRPVASVNNKLPSTSSKSSSNTKSSVGSKASKPSSGTSTASGTTAVTTVAAVAVVTAIDTIASSHSVGEDRPESPAAVEKPLSEQGIESIVVPAKSTEATVALALNDSGSVEPTEVALPLASSNPSAAVSSESLNEEPSVVESVIAESAEPSSLPAEPALTSETTAETVVEEAAAVVASAADELYADVYNDFDDLDNAPLDDDGAEEGTEMTGNRSFEALMNLTAQVAEFTVAVEPTEQAEEPQPDVSSSTAGETDQDLISAESVVKAFDVDDHVGSESTQFEPEANETDPSVHEPDVDSSVPGQVPATPMDASETALLKPEKQREEPIAETEAVNASTDVHEETVSDASPLSQTDSNDLARTELTHEDADTVAKDAKQDVLDEQPPRAVENEEPSAEEPDQNDQASTQHDADRPESRQTDASYADEDFDHSPEDHDEGAEQDRNSEEPTFGVEPFSSEFALAQLPVESPPVDNVPNSDQANNSDRLASEGSPSPDHVEEPQAHEPVVQDSDDYYGDADFAGDESLPNSAERDDANEVAPDDLDTPSVAKEDSGDFTVPREIPCAGEKVTAPPAETFDGQEEAPEQVEETEEEAEQVDVRSETLNHSAEAAVDGQVSAEEASPAHVTDDEATNDSVHVDGNQGGSERVVEASEAASLPDKNVRLVAEPTEDRANTPDGYEDAEFDNDPNEDPTLVADLISAGAENAAKESSTELADEYMSEKLDEQVPSEASEAALRVSLDQEEETTHGDQTATPPPASDDITADAVSEASATVDQGGAQAADDGEHYASTECTDPEGKPEAEVELTLDGDLASELADDSTIEVTEAAEGVATTTQSPNGHVVVNEPTSSDNIPDSDVDTATTDDQEPMGTTNIVGLGDEADKPVEDERAEMEDHSTPPREEPSEPRDVVDILSEPLVPEDPEPQLPEPEERPTTAQAYGDDDFDDETPREGSLAEQIATKEQPSSQDEPPADAPISVDNVTDKSDCLDISPDVEMPRPQTPTDLERPTTADAYAAEFEEEAAAESFGESTVKLNPVVDAEAVGGVAATMPLKTDDTNGQDALVSPSETYQDGQTELIDEVKEGESPPGMETQPSIEAEESNHDIEPTGEADVDVAQSESPDKVPSVPADSSPLAREINKGPETRPTTPSDSTAYEDDTLDDGEALQDVVQTSDDLVPPHEVTEQVIDDAPPASMDEAASLDTAPHLSESDASVPSELVDVNQTANDGSLVEDTPLIVAADEPTTNGDINDELMVPSDEDLSNPSENGLLQSEQRPGLLGAGDDTLESLAVAGKASPAAMDDEVVEAAPEEANTDEVLEGHDDPTLSHIVSQSQEGVESQAGKAEREMNQQPTESDDAVNENQRLESGVDESDENSTLDVAKNANNFAEEEAVDVTTAEEVVATSKEPDEDKPTSARSHVDESYGGDDFDDAVDETTAPPVADVATVDVDDSETDPKKELSPPMEPASVDELDTNEGTDPSLPKESVESDVAAGSDSDAVTPDMAMGQVEEHPGSDANGVEQQIPPEEVHSTQDTEPLALAAEGEITADGDFVDAHEEVESKSVDEQSHSGEDGVTETEPVVEVAPEPVDKDDSTADAAESVKSPQDADSSAVAEHGVVEETDAVSSESPDEPAVVFSQDSDQPKQEELAVVEPTALNAPEADRLVEVADDQESVADVSTDGQELASANSVVEPPSEATTETTEPIDEHPVDEHPPIAAPEETIACAEIVPVFDTYKAEDASQKDEAVDEPEPAKVDDIADDPVPSGTQETETMALEHVVSIPIVDEAVVAPSHDGENDPPHDGLEDTVAPDEVVAEPMASQDTPAVEADGTPASAEIRDEPIPISDANTQDPSLSEANAPTDEYVFEEEDESPPTTEWSDVVKVPALDVASAGVTESELDYKDEENDVERNHELGATTQAAEPDLAFVAVEELGAKSVEEEKTTTQIAVSEAVPAAAEDDEAIYKDEDHDYEEDAIDESAASVPTPAPSEPVGTTADSAGSPVGDEMDYEDFEAEDAAATTKSPRTEPPLTKQLTQEVLDDETPYGDDDDAYNDFEEDGDAPRPLTEKPTAPAPLEHEDEAYDDGFDDDDKQTPRATESHAVAAAPPPATAAASSPPAAADEDDYDAYEDFED